jgi:hypothetical protein
MKLLVFADMFLVDRLKQQCLQEMRDYIERLDLPARYKLSPTHIQDDNDKSWRMCEDWNTDEEEDLEVFIPRVLESQDQDPAVIEVCRRLLSLI